MNVRIPKYIKIEIDRLSKKLEHPREWVVSELLSKTLFEDEFLERFESHFFNEALPKMFNDLLSQFDVLDKMEEVLSRLGPTLDIADMQALEFNTRIAIEEIKSKFKLLYIIALSSLDYPVSIPEDFQSRGLIADLESDGFVEDVDGSLRMSFRAYQGS